MATVGVVRDNHIVTHLEGGDGAANFRDVANCLMTETPWDIGRSHVAVVKMEIGATDG